MPRNLALNISVGAMLDSTVGKVFKSAVKSAEALGDQQKSLNQQMRKLNAVRRYTDQLDKMKREADASGKVTESLARRMRLAEVRLSAASADAKRMGVNIESLGDAEARLNRQLTKNNAALKRREKLGAINQKMKTGAASAARGAAFGAVSGGTAAGAALAAVTEINRMNAEQANLAKTVGLSAKQMGIWSAIVGEAGLDGETVVDMVEELNNKFGESKGLGAQTTPVQEAMKILRLDFERLKQLKPDEQFKAIVEQAQKIGGQEAVSAADILLGGEANKIIGHLNSLNMPLDQLFDRFDRLYIGSEEGLAGAQTFNNAWTELSYSLGQAFAEVAGLIGSELAPQMKQFAEDLAGWFRTNRDDIKAFSGTLGSTLKSLGSGLVELASNLPNIVRAMTTLSDVVLRWFGDEPDPVQKINPYVNPNNVVASGTKAGGHGPITDMLRQDLDQMNHRDEEARMLVEGLNGAKTSTVNDNRTTTNTFNITQQPGQSGEQLADQIGQRIRSAESDRATNDGFSQAEAAT